MQEYERKLKSNSTIDMIFKGGYDYTTDGNPYCEEHFKLYRNYRDNLLYYLDEIHTRLDTGEFLKITTYYETDKDFTPLRVHIKKHIGSQLIEEKFNLEPHTNILTYRFLLNSFNKAKKFQVPAKFQISAPSIVTKFLFIGAKKFDPTGRNFQNILVSDNFWEFKEPPTMKFILLEKPSQVNAKLEIKGKTIKSTLYHLYSSENHEETGEVPLKVYMSKHYGIPYRVQMEGNTFIDIKYLNELDAKSVSDLFR